MKARVAVVVPTCNAGAEFPLFLEALCGQDYPADITIVDSSSDDETASFAGLYKLDLIEVSRASFNHGATRQSAVDRLADYDVVVFLTQDAVLADATMLRKILVPLQDTTTGAVCGRQLPRKGAALIEKHARIYNYPSKSFVRSFDDVNLYGLKTAFISNSFAAYRVSILREVGGFPADVIFGEDMYVATKMLKAGYKIAYAADACVYHSHAYSFRQEMQRYFDMGVFHAREPWIRQSLGGAEGEGLKFVASEYRYLMKHAILRVPEGMLRTLFRYAGFRLGLMEKNLPLWLKRSLAMNKGYFRK